MIFEKPTVSEESFIINDDLTVYYSLFKDDYVFTRPKNSWSRWEKFPYVTPTNNDTFIEYHNDEVEFDCCEHVSVAINGTATYTFMTPNGPKDYLWEYGTHNVDNGFGYLPKDTFTRTFHTKFELCCIVQPILGRANTTKYKFEILKGPLTLSKDAYAIHYCTGVLAKQTEYSLVAGTSITIDENDLAIIIYQE
jgi:hypothetical protein